jgi:hypothetical protein
MLRFQKQIGQCLVSHILLCVLWCMSGQEICNKVSKNAGWIFFSFQVLWPGWLIISFTCYKKNCSQGVSLMSQNFVWDFSPTVKNLGDLNFKTSTFQHCACLICNEHQASWFNLCDGKNKARTASFCPNTGATMSRLLRYFKRVVSNMWNTKITKRQCIIKSGGCLQFLVQH